ncbi:MAG: hypothetical protein VB127_04465 [Sphaerochaeta sp.]|nr:hypothetical protein [Sphaerochaeta sp.]
MKHQLLCSLIMLILLVGCGCEQSPASLHNLFTQTDSTPPKLLQYEAISSKVVLLTFDEPLDDSSVSIVCNTREPSSVSISSETLTICLEEELVLGQGVPLQGRVSDMRGNSLRFSLTLWARNQNPPTLLINEFTTKGSETNPDRVELLVTSRGNLAGITLYAGRDGVYSDRYIFPDRIVERGAHLVVAFSKSSAEDSLSSELQAGLSSNNGCLTLARSPEWESPLLDAVVWGNHTTTTHEGFGSEDLAMSVSYLAQHNQWNNSKSEGSIDSTESTATRSFCRDKGKDTNSKEDWYICATKEATFGSANSEKRHTP